jgi:hypothetical protein
MSRADHPRGLPSGTVPPTKRTFPMPMVSSSWGRYSTPRPISQPLRPISQRCQAVFAPLPSGRVRSALTWYDGMVPCVKEGTLQPRLDQGVLDQLV